MSGRILNPYTQFRDDTGLPVENGTVTFYINETTTLSTVWTDNTETVPQANPYTLDASGRITGDVYYTGVKTIVLKDQFGAEIRTVDDVAVVGDSDIIVVGSGRFINGDEPEGNMRGIASAADGGVFGVYRVINVFMTKDFSAEDVSFGSTIQGTGALLVPLLSGGTTQPTVQDNIVNFQVTVGNGVGGLVAPDFADISYSMSILDNGL